MGNPATTAMDAGTGVDQLGLRGQGETVPSYGLTTQIRLLAGLLAFSLTLTLALVFWSAKSQDKIAVEDSRHLANAAIGVQLSHLQKTLIDYTFWDDAYERTVEGFDPDWFDENFGDADYLRDTFGITTSFIAAPDNRVLRLMVDSEIVDDAPAQNIGAQVEGGLDKLVQDARRLVDGEFMAVGGLVKIDGLLHFAVARAIHPHTEEMLSRIEVTPAKAYVAAFMRPLDSELLETVANDFDLTNLSYSADIDLPAGLTQPLYSADGQQYGTLTWQIDLPSRHVLYGVLPALLAAIACVGMLSWYVLNGLRQGQTKLLQAMQRARAADRTKNEFLANMSHELRTPLSAIIGFSEMMRTESQGPIGTDVYKEYLDDIHLCGTHLLVIIDEILDISKIEAGEFKLREETLDLFAVVEDAMHVVRTRADEAQTDLVMNIPAGVPRLMGDERAIKKILLNLLGNAVKFNRPCGQVTVSASADPVEGMVIQVSDTGIGLAAKDLEIAFTPFRQVDVGFGRSHEGAGLGLPLSKALIELHGGTLALESTLDVGTTAIVRFPASRLELMAA